jgi:hypothetical protein
MFCILFYHICDFEYFCKLFCFLCKYINVAHFFWMWLVCSVLWCYISESESESRYNWRSVSRSVLVLSPLWGSWPDIYSFRKLQSCLYGAPSLTREWVCHLSGMCYIICVLGIYLCHIFLLRIYLIVAISKLIFCWFIKYWFWC